MGSNELMHSLIIKAYREESKKMGEGVNLPSKQRLYYPPFFKWSGISVAVFCVSISVVVYFVDGKIDLGPFSVIMVFALMGVYIYLGSYDAVEFDDHYIYTSSIFAKSKKLSWKNVISYSFNPIMQYHRLIFKDSEKVNISPGMYGISQFMEKFVLKYDGLLWKSSQGSRNHFVIGQISLALASSSDPNIQSQLWREYSKATAQVKPEILRAIMMNVVKTKRCLPEIFSQLPPSVQKELNEFLENSTKTG